MSECVRSESRLLCEAHDRALWPSLAKRCNGWIVEQLAAEPRWPSGPDLAGPHVRERLERLLRQSARGGQGFGFNADMHEEVVVDAILAALQEKRDPR